MKRKIIAITTVLLLLAIPLSIAEANEPSGIINNVSSKVEILSVNPGGSIITEEIFLSDEDLAELEYKISQVMDEIPSIKDWGNLRELIEKIFGQDNPLFKNFIELFSKFRLFGNRGFVISSGHGYDLNPLKKISFKIRKRVAFWYYSSNGISNSKTIILKPFVLNMKTLSGTQFGVMTKFIGVYLFISSGYLRDSYTFFMGTAHHINGFDFIS